MYEFQESLPKELLRLKRASMKLSRLIKERVYISRTPLVKCPNHGELFLKDVIKSGKIKRTGEQQYKCKVCMSKFHKKHYQDNKEKVLGNNSQYRKNNPDKIKELWKNYKEKLNGKNN